MTNGGRLAIALSPRWMDDFVGPAERRRVFAAFPDRVECDPTSLARGEFQRWILEHEPRAILTGWGTPMLPSGALPTLGIVGHTAGSVRGVVTREMIERGLIVTNWGPAAGASVAECALLLVLASLRRLTRWTLMIHRDNGWPAGDGGNDGLGLYGRRVGIHGFGNVARQFVRLIAPFGCRVRAYSAGVPDDFYAAHGVEPAGSLASLFADSDVLVEVEALNDATRGSVTETLLRSLPPQAVFVNVGRGAVVDQRALERVVADGALNCGLDVFDPEPPPTTSPLRGLPNVTLTPHVAGPTVDQRRTCGARAIDALCRFAAGEPVDRPITPEEFDRAT